MSIRMLLLMAILFPQLSGAQDTVSFSTSEQKTVSLYLNFISSQSKKLRGKLAKKYKKALQKNLKIENGIYRKVSNMDSGEAASIFKHLASNNSDPLPFVKASLYIPQLDTIETVLKFLKEKIFELPPALEEDISMLKLALNKTSQLKIQLKEKKEFLKETLLKSGLGKQFNKLNKQLFYFTEQLDNTLRKLKDHDKISEKAIIILKRSRLFEDFFKRNSELSTLFRLVTHEININDAASLGLQTRPQINNLILTQFLSSVEGRNVLTENIGAAQSELQKIKNKVTSANKPAGGFRPNHQKTNPFIKRIELGTNIQTEKAKQYFPVTTDIALTVGYKLNEKSIIGIGASYKIGFGKNWRNIRMSHEGLGLRSFLDWKLKKSFFISGGFEMNYRKSFRNIRELENYPYWQQSGIIGLTKILSARTTVFKKTKLQLLWDFLSYSQLPRTSPVLFRLGYNF